MVRDQWYVVLESKEVTAKPVGVTRMGEKMVFWRNKHGKVFAAVDHCPHRGAALSMGKIKEDHLQCPFHGFEFDNSGACVLIPANGKHFTPPSKMKLVVYPTFEAHDWIWIWWGENPPAELPEPEYFDNLDSSFIDHTVQDHWTTHYSRVIENQLDVVHLPFIHGKTIGRGGRELVDGPVVEWQGDKMLYTYVFNRVDDGVAPKKPNELSPKPKNKSHLEFIFPNLWQNYISENLRVIAAFVPIDDENSILYLRYSQNFIRIKGLRKLVSMLGGPLNLYIAHEDRRVVITQRPKRSAVKMDEVLIQGDLPIIEYRKKREHYLSLAQK